ncbi:hypothetical protein Pcinc_041220 [Petrolisthes cinctipes]|uniref:Uncharacterized protein n=1 Tax=Petrolisthes cinctipes TaxID=88211 RepID=A0AAE1BKM0_PETCI|nr:hypothetical protein Pcinc_041220 [Petrolisthes cinctipes]
MEGGREVGKDDRKNGGERQSEREGGREGRKDDRKNRGVKETIREWGMDGRGEGERMIERMKDEKRQSEREGGRERGGKDDRKNRGVKETMREGRRHVSNSKVKVTMAGVLTRFVERHLPVKKVLLLTLSPATRT